MTDTYVVACRVCRRVNVRGLTAWALLRIAAATLRTPMICRHCGARGSLAAGLPHPVSPEGETVKHD